MNFATATAGLTDTVTDSSKNGKYAIADGTTWGDGYFKLKQNGTKTTYYTNKDRTKINAIELGSYSSNNTYIEFTVTGSAEITVSATSTGGSNTSYVEIIEKGKSPTKESATVVSGTSSATEVKKSCTAGTYYIAVWTDNTDKSLARITLLKAVQTVD